jgi:hypothetical protein
LEQNFQLVVISQNFKRIILHHRSLGNVIRPPSQRRKSEYIIALPVYF